MNHEWASQHAKQRFSDLSAEARGAQLLRMGKSDNDEDVTEKGASLLSRTLARLSSLAARNAKPATRPTGR